MKKSQLFILLTVFLIALAGSWGVLNIRGLLSNKKPAAQAASALFVTGTQVIPTVALATPTTPCDTKHVPGVASDPTEGMGSPAIKPHLCRIPTFSEQDVRQYMQSFSKFTSLRIEQLSAHFTVTRVLFVTNEVANDILYADTGVVDTKLIVCYVEVFGDFTVASPPFRTTSGKQAIYHHGQMAFDGVTGNMLVIGVRE